MSDEERGEAGENVVEEERFYQEAKRRYDRAGTRLDEAEKALEQWKQEHGDDNDRYRELDQRVNTATQNLQITDQAFQNAERRWKDARAAAKKNKSSCLSRSEQCFAYSRCTLPFIIVVLTAVCYFFGTCSKGEKGILGMRYWAWVVGGINAALIVVWANVLPGLKDFLDYMGSTSTSAINLLEQQVSISNPILNPPEISRLAEQTIEEQVSISNPISTPPEIQSVDRSLVISN